jgi:hypothetical protein
MYRETLEDFIKSPYFKKSILNGAARMTMQKVEILPDKWFLLSQKPGNLYNPEGILLWLPNLEWSNDELEMFLSEEENTEDEFFSQQFENNKIEIEQEIRDDLEYELISLTISRKN